MWAPVATSCHDRRLWLPLPEAPGLAMPIRCWKSLSVLDRRPGPCPALRREVGQADRWCNPACSCPSWRGKVKVWIITWISSFSVGDPSSLAWSGGALSGMGCMVPQPFAAGGNWSYLEFWAITGDPWYPRY
jgi:hypothetical protein